MKNIADSKFILYLFTILLVIFVLQTPLSALNPLHDEGCAGCHSLHNSPGQALTSFAEFNDLCLSCHGPAGTATTVTTHKGTSNFLGMEQGCVKCHNPHDYIQNSFGTMNLSQIGHDDGVGIIPTPISGDKLVIFDSRGTDAGDPVLHSFADGDSTYDGVCEVCHTQTSHHRNSNSGGDHTHYVGQTCTDCHAHDNDFEGVGGSCTGCHSTPKGPRRAIMGEFSLTSHHVMAGAATDDDCGVCHYEPQGAHGDGSVDLLDPDTGIRLSPFASFSRNTSSASLESWVSEVQDEFCMKCHDSDGATATNFSGNAMRPFSSGAVDVPNVFDQFSTGNSYHHAVRGTVGNSFCNSSTMEAPWDSGGPHLISCFDCHGTSGHGSANQRMLRTSIDLDTMEAGSSTITIGAQVESYCIICHKASVYLTGTGAAYSKFENHPSDTSNHGAGSGNELGCLGCHAGIVNETSVGDNGSSRGNLHGGSLSSWPSDSWASGSSSNFFMVGGYISGWKANSSSGKNGCGGGNCSHPGSARQFKPGKEYTITVD